MNRPIQAGTIETRPGWGHAEDVVPIVAGLANRDATDPAIRTWAARVVAGVPRGDVEAEARAILAAAERDVRYTDDPLVRRPDAELETHDLVQAPIVTLDTGAGDCVAFAGLIGAGLQSVGRVVRYTVTSIRPGVPRHITVEVQAPGGWYTIDPVPQPRRVGYGAALPGAEMRSWNGQGEQIPEGAIRVEGPGGVGLGGPLDDLTTQLAEVEAISPEISAGVTATRERIGEMIEEWGPTAREVGGTINQLKELADTFEAGPDKERIANALLGAMAATVNAMVPGLGSLMQMAVQILWRLAKPVLRALSEALREPTRWDAAVNYWIHQMRYAGGAYEMRVSVGGMANAHRDGWWVLYGNPGRAPTGFGARSLVDFWQSFSNLRWSQSACHSPPVRATQLAAIPLLHASADAIDSLINEGDIEGAREPFGKLVALCDKVLPLGRERFEDIMGIPAAAVLDPALFPDYGDTPTTMEESGDPAFDRFYMGNREAFDFRFDLISFKVNRLPADVWDGVVAGLFVENPEEWPCDGFVRQMLFQLTAQQYSSGAGPVLASLMLSLNERLHATIAGTAAPIEMAPRSMERAGLAPVGGYSIPVQLAPPGTLPAEEGPSPAELPAAEPSAPTVPAELPQAIPQGVTTAEAQVLAAIRYHDAVRGATRADAAARAFYGMSGPGLGVELPRLVDLETEAEIAARLGTPAALLARTDLRTRARQTNYGLTHVGEEGMSRSRAADRLMAWKKARGFEPIDSVIDEAVRSALSEDGGFPLGAVATLAELARKVGTVAVPAVEPGPIEVLPPGSVPVEPGPEAPTETGLPAAIAPGLVPMAPPSTFARAPLAPSGAVPSGGAAPDAVPEAPTTPATSDAFPEGAPGGAVMVAPPGSAEITIKTKPDRVTLALIALGVYYAAKKKRRA